MITWPRYFLLMVLMLNLFWVGTCMSQTPEKIFDSNRIVVAPVTLDGNVLFEVRGMSSLPAAERAKSINRRIKYVASNESIPSNSIVLNPKEEYITINISNHNIMQVYDADALLEGVKKEQLAEFIKIKLEQSIDHYRYQRSRPAIIENLIHALIVTVGLVILIIVLLWLIRLLNKSIQKKIKSQIDSVDNISFQLIKSNQIWIIFHGLFRTIRIILLIGIFLFFVDYVLSLFPWTNPTSKYILTIIGNPLMAFGKGFIEYIPSLIFLVIIFYITKYFLRLIRLFFTGMKQGAIQIKDFHPEWAMSTYKIVRIVVVAFSLVIAYPYIPGSDSVAFKGISVFIGILFSLGSSSFIGNIIAGYSMLYRGAFKIGDRIEVDDQVGFVEDQKLLVTRLRSTKNEEIVIPNSVLLNSKITNYSSRSQEWGVILHTVVGIGYETPWRQVDAMLKLAANRTEGILKNPAPFVLKKELADFAVTYEINGYCKDIQEMNKIYSILHGNILDVFNENNVQIMTPNYEGDPETPKVVPNNQWDVPLANNDTTINSHE